MLGEGIPLSCILSLCTYMLFEYITLHMTPASFAIKERRNIVSSVSRAARDLLTLLPSPPED